MSGKVRILTEPVRGRVLDHLAAIRCSAPRPPSAARRCSPPAATTTRKAAPADRRAGGTERRRHRRTGDHRAPATRGAVGDEVTFGSNYSDPKDSAAIAAAVDGHRARRHDQHGRPQHYQENFNTYIQQPDDVMSLVRRLPHAGVRRARAWSATSATCGPASTGFSEGFKSASHRARRQAVLRAVLLLPVGRALPEEPVRGEGLRDPHDLGRVHGAVRQDADRRDHAARRRQRR